MALKVRPKAFGPVYALFDGSDGIRYSLASLEHTSQHPPSDTPVDTLLASLAACIIKSVQWSAGQQKAPLNPFSVKVSAVKAPELPGRIESMEIAVLGQPVDDPVLVPAIVAQAKSACTISNSLNCKVSVVICEPD
ncbi:OsmC family protein [Leisingera sp. McT4-56]|uniref:OsmC family protein n=1 Tax=Leisingera sp. McT4-56 TaxID=2881255 RepID=UPI001CF83DE4|nr:OsmC family protein [Leisingera sp. McT4-56]MCB4455972.1 OsmC family protein [Leisingera sp. McT4-56]